MDNTTVGRVSSSFSGGIKSFRPSQNPLKIDNPVQSGTVDDQVTISGLKDNNKETAVGEKISKMETFSQDPFVAKPAPDSIEKEKIGKELKGPRVYAFDNKNPIAIADPEGNYFYGVDEPAFNQVNSFVVTYKTIDMLQEFAGRKIEWAFGDEQMGVNAHSGEGANAFYSRWQKSTNFLSFHSSGLKKRVNTSQSAEIVSHETGHAGLDGMRPRYISSWDPEARAVHEAFADSSAMLYTLSREDSLKGIVSETGGDLSKPNRLAYMGEEFGASRRLSNTNPDDDHKTYLRNAQNTFKYKPASELPEKAPEDELASESHSYSRVFSGAFYDIISNLNKTFIAEGASGEDSLKKTREIAGNLLVKAVDIAPTSSISFKAMAQCMIKAGGLLYGDRYKNQMAEAFLNRNILKPSDIRAMDEERADSSVVLERTPDSREEALSFLKTHEKALGIDASMFSQAETVVDKYGNRHLGFTSKKEVSLKNMNLSKGEKNKPVFTEVYGGITLTFDKNGKLACKTEDKIDRKKIDQALDAIKKSNDEGTIRMKPLYQNYSIFKSKNTPYEAQIQKDPKGRYVLERIPVIVN